MNVNGFTRICGLIGNPVEHTMSPAIHNTLAAAMGENLVYVPFHVTEGCLEAAVKGAYSLNLLGVNVTIPYKSQVIPFLKEMDPLAETIGAVNTLVRTDGGFKGFNTDMPGLYRAMCEDGVSIEGEHVLILGAGGVARAVAIMAAKKGAAEITILNRTVEKARTVAEEVNSMAGKSLVNTLTLKDYTLLSEERRYLAIQATNVGMYPDMEKAVLEEAAFYKKVHTGYDLIFNPTDTRFMRLVRENGGRAYNGLKMLLYQGIIAYELWTGRTVGDALVRRAYEEMSRNGSPRR